MVGGSGEREEAYYGRDIGNADDWIQLFESTGIDFQSHASTIDAFENFLLVFYPQEGLSGDDWDSIREEFADMYGWDMDDDAFWDAWREAIGYGRE